MAIKIARQLAGYSQEDLAKRIGVDPNFLADVETGERDLEEAPYRAVTRLAAALHLAPATVMGLARAERARVRRLQTTVQHAQQRRVRR